MSDRDEYQVVLALPKTRQILLANERGELRLPRATIPRWTRPAQALTEALHDMWRVDTVVIDFLPERFAQSQCAVVEVLQMGEQLTKSGLTPVEADRVSNSGLSDRDLATVRQILAGHCGSRGPFSRVGWMRDAQEWIKSAVNDRGVEFTGRVRQLSGYGTCALVRFATRRGPAFWLKAVDKPNAHEFHVTMYLSENCPTYLARLVCARSDWNAWVMEEGGQPLAWPLPLPQVEQVVARMAEMQGALVGKTDELLGYGCVDQRIEVLQAHIDDLMAYLAEAMERQTSTKVPRLRDSRLRELGDILRAACSAMRVLNIPDSLLHNDLNAGNILFDGARCVLIDWSDAYIGNPFLAFRHLCALWSRSEDMSLPWVQHFKTIYKSRWRDFLTDSQMDQAFALTPLLAVLSRLYGRGLRLASSQRNESHFEGYARSLARYMDRAAQNLQLIEVL